MRHLDYDLLGLNIKDQRRSLGLTQRDLAELVYCNPSHISNIENGYTKVGLDLLLAIANALDTSIDSLLKDQYKDTLKSIDTEIIKAFEECDDSKKEMILRIIKVL